MAFRSRSAVLLFSSSHMKFGALPLLLLNSIRSEKSSSAMRSGKGLAGRLRGGKYPPLVPEEVDGRDSRSSLTSEDDAPVLAVCEEGDGEVTVEF